MIELKSLATTKLNRGVTSVKRIVFVSTKKEAVKLPTEGELPFIKPPPTKPPADTLVCAIAVAEIEERTKNDYN